MPKRNIYLNDQDVETWDNLPSGERSKLLRNVLDNHREYNLMTGYGVDDELYKKMYLYDSQLQEARLIFNKYYEYENMFEEYEERVMATEKEIEKKFKVKLQTMAYYDKVHNEQEFVDLIFDNANNYATSKKTIIDEHTKEEYTIETVQDGAIYINKKSSNSNKLITIKEKSIRKVVDNLNKKGGTLIRINLFSESPLHRLVIVELHPKLNYVSRWVVWQPNGGE